MNAITAADVAAVAKKIITTPLSMASYGDGMSFFFTLGSCPCCCFIVELYLDWPVTILPHNPPSPAPCHCTCSCSCSTI